MSLLARQLAKQLVTKQSWSRHLASVSQAGSNKNDSNHKKSKWSNFSRSLVISCGIASGVVAFNVFKDDLQQILPELPKVSASTVAASRRSQFNFLADVVDIAAKSVVYIEIQDTRRMDYKTGKPATVSNGSGFIVESDGLILTNAHVVINKPRCNVSVKLSDGRTFMGIVEAVDPISDLATVRVQCKNLPAMKLGLSSSLRAGEFVVALGSPLCKLSYQVLGAFKDFQLSSIKQHRHCRRHIIDPAGIEGSRPRRS